MIRFSKHSGIYTLETEQILPISVGEAWEFFSSPKNLQKITPSHMGFEITSGDPDQMYPGQIITYSIGLFPGIKSNWVTEITHVTKERFFVDEQKFGPYKMWHHEHHFEPHPEGIRMTDKVSYKLPFGILGRMMHGIMIKPQLRKVFGFRFDILNQFFKTQYHDKERVLQQ
jgi:ligand-binding SRPBCC domain-containing protein